MEFNGGVLIIGSLLWDIEGNLLRREWQKSLLMTEKRLVPLPIRYGRKSSSRANTYSMVFSNELTDLNKLGVGYSVPFKSPINLEDQFQEQVLKLARAEGLDPDNLG